MKKSTIRLLMSLICLTSFSIFFVDSTAYAGPYGIPDHQGWFTSTNFVNGHGGSVLDICSGSDDPISSSTDKATFIAAIKNYLDGKDKNGNLCSDTTKDRNVSGAQFIIQTMRSDDENLYRTRPTAADIADWEARINNPAVEILYDSNLSYSWNSQYSGYTGVVDDMFLWLPGSAPSLIFKYNGEQRYWLKINCGNPVGDGLGLPRPATAITTSSVVPAQVYPGDDVEFKHTITATGSIWGKYTISRYTKNPSGTLAGGVSLATLWVSIGTVITPTSATLTNRVYSVPSWAVIDSQYCESISLTDMNNGVSDTSSEACALVIERLIVGTVTPTSSVYPATAEPGDPVTFNHSIDPSQNLNLDGSYTIKRFEVSDINDPTPNIEPVISGGLHINNGAVTAPVDPPDDIRDREWQIPGSNAIGKLWCEELRLYNLGSISEKTSRACARVVARPIVKFNGLDVDFCTNSVNPTPSVGNVYTWARLNNGGVYIGSSSQYALFVYDAINDQGTSKEGFFSDKTIGDVTNPKALTFANTSGTFGTDWGGATPCTNYFDDEYGTNGEKLPADHTGIETPASGSIASRTIQPGEHTTVYIKGDAVISGDIVYAGSNNWGSASNIPSFRLIVSGNIYITSSTTTRQLDGFYFAGGNIYTCTNGASATFPGYDACKGQLIVTGAFEAMGSIKYWRTGGTLSQDTPAETFIFSPEMLLSEWLGSSNSSQNPIRSIKSMPPVF